MTDFTTYTVETAPAAAKPLLEGAQKSLGFVPNLFATMATSPALLEAYQTLSGIFEKTNLSETERQIILMTNNLLNGCDYCMAAHTTISQGANIPADVIEALRNDTPLTNPQYEALRTFTKAVNLSRGWPSEDEIQAFLNAGYTKETVLEVVMGTGLKVLSNYTNHIATTALDPQFAANRWDRNSVKAA